MRRHLAAAALLLAVPACDTAPIDTADASPPEVRILVRQAGEYQHATVATLYIEPVELTAVAEDPEGLRSLKLRFLGRKSDNCTLAGQPNGGSYPVSLPEDREQVLQGDAEGRVLTKLPLFATISDHQTCTVPGKAGTGRPLGHTFRVRATATNWNEAAAPVVSELQVTIE